MQRIEIRITPPASGGAQAFSLDTPDLRTALIVADINLGGGTAEIWRDHRRLASMRKQQKVAGQPFWVVC